MDRIVGNGQGFAGALAAGPAAALPLAGFRRRVSGRVALPALVGAFLAAVLAVLATQAVGPARVSGHRGLSPSVSPAPLVSTGLLRLPPAAQATVSAALGAHQPAYRITGFSGRNPAQDLSVRFLRSGALISSRGAAFTLGLRALGRGSHLVALAPVSPSVDAAAIEYRYPRTLERWSNGPLGLEQSFVLARRPAGTAPLSFVVAIPAGARVSHGTVLLPSGLRYAGLRAEDATGRSLPAWITLRGGEAVINVSDRGARYPITVDPFVQQAQLSPSDGAALDEFGTSIAVEGSTVVVGSPDHTTNGLAKAGAVYVFQEGAHGWANGTQTAELTASNAAASDELGSSVAISGNTIVAGAPYPPDTGDWGGTTDCSGIVPGSVYVYTMPAGGWHNMTQSSELTPSFPFCNGAEVGASVGISGNTIVAGAPDYHTTTSGSYPDGAAFVWTLPSSTPAILTSSDEETRSSLGASVAISGNTIVAGDPTWNGTGYYGKGSVYVYAEPAGGWRTGTQTSELAASDADVADELGTSVAISGSTIAAGSPYHGAGNTPQEGAVYLYVEPGGGWPTHMTQTAELTPSEGAGTQLGWSVGISGTEVIGGPTDDAGANGSGAGYLFTEPSTGWPATMTQTQELTETPVEHGSYFGYTVAIWGTTAVVGAEEGEPGGVSIPPATGLIDVFGPGSSPPPASATAKVVHVSVQGSTVEVKIRCTGTAGAHCPVALAASTAEKLRKGKVVELRAGASGTKKHWRVVVVVRKSATLSTGQTRTVTLTLSGAGKGLLKKFHTVPAKLVVTAGHPQGKAIYSKLITFVQPKPKKHKKK